LWCGYYGREFNATLKDGVILEVNAAPGFRMHLAPSEGLPRNVAAPVIDMFILGKSCRIPIIAVVLTVKQPLQDYWHIL
jgi:hypothetical protein